jgi:uncharacterized protein YyaL (SSP411 family)
MSTAGNRLSNETSAYLLQHAHNPVDWYPWGEEALSKARREDKVIFLSIGFSACHWCHVMERESFEDDVVATLLNTYFVSIKVDREEHPDLDELYMNAVQLMTGTGGWPLNLFLTPDLKPFFGGTYFPPQSTKDQIGFKELVISIASLWQEERERVVSGALKIVDFMKMYTQKRAGSLQGVPSREALQQAVAAVGGEYDQQYAGFGTSYKFPPYMILAFLLRCFHRSREQPVLQMCTATMDAMAAGGIFDQLGGGFHRYATDRKWNIPHFEKMTYDNAMLAALYCEGYQITGKQLYRQVAEATFGFLLAEMQGGSGGFYSSLDADSGGREGAFYTWRRAEIMDVLGPEQGALLCDYFSVRAEGNIPSAEAEMAEQNVLYTAEDLALIAQKYDTPPHQIAQAVRPLCERLLQSRRGRIAPARDETLIASWNGLTISALVKGYQVLGNREYLQAAQRAAGYILETMFVENTLCRLHARGHSSQPGFIDDYAHLTQALLDLYETSFNLRWLKRADELAGRMNALFWDAKNGGFFFSPSDRSDLIIRSKTLWDNPLPSGNAEAARALMRLGLLLERPEWCRQAETVLSVARAEMENTPIIHMAMYTAADYLLHPLIQIGLVGETDKADLHALLKEIWSVFLPGRQCALLAGKRMIDGKATAYVCKGSNCLAPTNDPKHLAYVLEIVDE